MHKARTPCKASTGLGKYGAADRRGHDPEIVGEQGLDQGELAMEEGEPFARRAGGEAGGEDQAPRGAGRPAAEDRAAPEAGHLRLRI